MREASKKWGAEIKRFEVVDLYPNDRVVRNSLHKRAVAEREKKEAILRADGFREQQIRIADGNFIKTEKEAEG